MLGFLKRALRPRTKAQLTEAEWMGGLDMRMEGGAKAQVTNPYRQSPFVYSGIRGKARSVAGVPFVLKVGRRKTKQGVPLPETHALSKLFSDPSPFMNTSQMFEALTAFYDLFGEWFLIKISGKIPVSTAGQKHSPFAGIREYPAELLRVSPKNVTLNETDIDARTGLIRQWTVRMPRGNETIKVPVESMIQGALLNPDDDYRGLSPLEAAKQAILLEYKADAYSNALLDNQATPNGILAAEYELNKDKADLIRKQWAETHGGARRGGKVGVLGKGLTWQSTAQSSKDMEMPQTRKLSREEIRAVLGVTPFETGDIGDFNRASATAAKAWLWENTLVPTCHAIEDVFWSGLFRFLPEPNGAEVWGEFDLSQVEALQASVGEKVVAAQGLFDVGYSLNQVNERLKLGMPNVPWGDEPGGVGEMPLPGMIPIIDAPATAPGSGLVQITDASSGGGALTVVGGGGGITVRNVRSRTGDVRSSAAGRRARGAWSRSGRVSAPPLSVVTKALTRKAQARLIHGFQVRATRTVARSLAAFYRHMRDRAIAAADGEKAVRHLSPDQVERLLGTPDEWRRYTEEFMLQPMQATAIAALRNAETLLGGFDVIELNDPRWLVGAAQRTAEFVRTSIRWRDEIRDRIIESYENVESLESLADAIDEHFGRVIRSNGMTIARTETGMLGSQIRDQALKDEGVEKTEWSATLDDHTRDSHANIDGEQQPIGTPFSNGLMYPLQPGGAAEEVINCRCVALPV